MNKVFSLIVGSAVWVSGLIVGGMANPAKGHWFSGYHPRVGSLAGLCDGWGPIKRWPSLPFARRPDANGHSVAIRCICPPPVTLIKRLVGRVRCYLALGWGLAGMLTPAPGLVLLGAGFTQGLIFVLAMLAGMLLFQGIEGYRDR